MASRKFIVGVLRSSSHDFLYPALVRPSTCRRCCLKRTRPDHLKSSSRPQSAEPVRISSLAAGTAFFLSRKCLQQWQLSSHSADRAAVETSDRPRTCTPSSGSSAVLRFKRPLGGRPGPRGNLSSRALSSPTRGSASGSGRPPHHRFTGNRSTFAENAGIPACFCLTLETWNGTITGKTIIGAAFGREEQRR